MDHPLFWFETIWTHVGRKPLSTGILTTIANNKIPCGVMSLEIFITFTNKNLEPHNQLARVFEVFTIPFAACSYVKIYTIYTYVYAPIYIHIRINLQMLPFINLIPNIHLITPSLMRGYDPLAPSMVRSRGSVDIHPSPTS